MNSTSCRRRSCRPGRRTSPFAALWASTSTIPAWMARHDLTRTDTRMDFRWTLNSPGRGIPFDWYSARWTGTLTVPSSGVTRIGVEGNDGYRLYLDDRIVIDNWQKRSYGTRTAPVSLAPGSTHRIKLEYFETTGVARVKLIWDAGVTDTSRAAIDEAVAAARACDVAIIVAGVEEGEFRDRAKLGLPGRQPELIDAVAATGKPTIVVLIGGSAITMPWLEKRRRRARRVVSGRSGRGGRRGRSSRRCEPGRPIAHHVPGVRGPASAVLQPQADGPRRRLRRPDRHGAVPVRLRLELHDVRVFGFADRAGGDSRGRRPPPCDSR